MFPTSTAIDRLLAIGRPSPSIRQLLQAQLAPSGIRRQAKRRPRPSCRSSSSSSSQPAPSLITTLSWIVIPITGLYIIYRAHSAFYPDKAYPEAIDGLLRQALIAEHRSDFRKSEILFQQAYQQSKRSRPSGPDHNPKESQHTDKLQIIPPNADQNIGDLDPIQISAIAIRWASLLERLGKIDRAIQVYELALNDLRGHTHQDQRRDSSLSFKNSEIDRRIRSIEISQKLADLSSKFIQVLSSSIDNSDLNENYNSKLSSIRSLESKVEEYLTWSVEEIMRIQRSSNNHHLGLNIDPPSDSSDQFDPSSLPSWVGRLNVPSCFESLASFYARRGKIDYALPLYLQTLNLLIPPPRSSNESMKEVEIQVRKVSDQERCQAATVMNNIAECLVTRFDSNQQPVQSRQEQHNEAKGESGGREKLLKNSMEWLNKSIDLTKLVLEDKDNKKLLLSQSHENFDRSLHSNPTILHPSHFLTECLNTHHTSTQNLKTVKQKIDQTRSKLDSSKLDLKK